MTETGREQRRLSLMREAINQFEGYQRTGEQSLLARAVPLLRAARAAAMEGGAPGLAAYHNNLAYALHEVAAATGDPAVQAEAVDCHRAAVAAAGPADFDRPGYLLTLASGLCALYGFTRDAGLLREAVTAAEAAAGRGVEPSLAVQYAIAGDALGQLYRHDPERQRDPALLARVIGACREAASYADILEDPAVAAKRWGTLGSWLVERYERAGDAAALAEAIAAARQAVAAAGPEHPDRGGYLNNLRQALLQDWDRTGNRATLDEAVRVARAAVDSAPPGAPGRAQRHAALSSLLDRMAELTGEAEMVAEAIAAARASLAATPADDPRRAGRLDDLGSALTSLFRYTGDSKMLAEAVRVRREALAMTAAGHPGRTGLSLLYLDDHDTDPLTVADVASRRLPGGLAYLSACETTVTSVALVNESVHLTGAFQLAGYQHVVGTLWRAGDYPSALLARDFYTALVAGGAGASGAARALHQATTQLRRQFPDRPTLWAGYIHAGP
jgi:hypothetical protein